MNAGTPVQETQLRSGAAAPPAPLLMFFSCSSASCRFLCRVLVLPSASIRRLFRFLMSLAASEEANVCEGECVQLQQQPTDAAFTFQVSVHSSCFRQEPVGVVLQVSGSFWKVLVVDALKDEVLVSANHLSGC